MRILWEGFLRDGRKRKGGNANWNKTKGEKNKKEKEGRGYIVKVGGFYEE